MDPVEAQTDLGKHGVDFEQAATVFMDRLAVTIPDGEHSGTEARWMTLGRDTRGHYVLVVHTFEWFNGGEGASAFDFGKRAHEGRIRNYEAQVGSPNMISVKASEESSSGPMLNFDCRSI